MQVYVEPSGRRIAPFDDPIGETPIRNRPLLVWQAEAFAAAGLTPIAELVPPCLVVPDTLLATGDALRAFVDAAAGRDAVYVLGESRFGRATVPVQPGVDVVPGGWRFNAIRFVSGRGEPPVELVIDPLEWKVDFPIPRHYTGTNVMEFGVPLRGVMTLHHWVHILWANQLVGGMELRRTPRWKLILRGLWAVVRALSFNKWKVLAKLTRAGRGCDIHPTAVVEGCTLGKRVVVGPHARVAFSDLGDDVIVMAGAGVSFSILGDRSLVADDCIVRSCVLYPGAAASQLLMQQSVLGRDVITTKGSGTLDLSFDAPIKVPLDGRMHSTTLHFLGSAFGHRSRIATGFYLAPGRTVPNDYFLIRDPAQICSVLPPGLAGQPLIASGAKARPLGLAASVLRRAGEAAGSPKPRGEP